MEIIDIKNINFSNHGLRKNTIEGEVFSKKFKINLNKNLSQIDFDLLNSGISARLNLISKKSEMSYIGKLKGKILDSNFRLNFSFKQNTLKIEEFFFRNKKLSFTSDGYLETKPFFNINLSSKIKEVDLSIFKNLDI